MYCKLVKYTLIVYWKLNKVYNYHASCKFVRQLIKLH